MGKKLDDAVVQHAQSEVAQWDQQKYNSMANRSTEMTNKKYDYIVYVGRFEPPHFAHVQTVQMAAERANNVIVLVGSANQPRTIKNPWTWRERAEMITSAVSEEINSKMFIYPVRDKLYNDQQWAGQVQDAVEAVMKMTTSGENPSIAIIGYSKDESTYYLNLFPQWELVDTGNIDDIHATDIRDAYFSCETESQFDQQVGHSLPLAIRDYLRAFSLRAEYDNLVNEYDHITRYKQSWESAPYPPTFVTTDAVVIQSGHVLLVRRRSAPGRNLWALVGGFVDQHELLIDAMVRELKEETKLKVPAPVLKGSITKQRVYDAPNRSLRGRTITHAFCIELPAGELPKVKGSSDAAHAKWVPLSTFWKMEEQMFEDHYAIVEDLIGTQT